MLQKCFLFSLGLFLVLGLALGSCRTEPSGSGNPHSPIPNPRITVQLQQVLDGDTIEVMVSSGEIKRVRLTGIDAPESGQFPWGPAAQDFLRSQISDRTLQLEFDLQTEDPFGRQLAYVWQQQQLLNEKVVAAGYALAVPYFPNVRYENRFQQAQDAARLQGLGIWDPQNPLRQPPAEFRQQKAQ